ncbi:Metal Dependent Phosphohydrolase [Streptomyces leeuwenhoekii]|uniref:Metal Dependent Phosphohydrolase n=2 Tax=Streptomyces leeuwenhoekii TaxID=1437453 RepID=A0A0F7VMN8_STRLW|nr:Metal Dependent Phosphohydrolase [Streptomyces leeuwenhoekii]
MAMLPLSGAVVPAEHGAMTEMTTTGVPPLPESPLARRTLALVRETESTPTANHSVRSYLFARLCADHRGAQPGRDYDPELLFLACVLHDIGLTEAGDRKQRFEVDGADTAAEFLTAQGVPSADVDDVWEAIALHTSPGIAERRGTLCALVHTGTGMDFGLGTDFVDDATGAAIHAAYPRLSMATTLTDEIVAQARRRPEKAPRFSVAAELVRERAVPPHTTWMETNAGAGRWGN